MEGTAYGPKTMRSKRQSSQALSVPAGLRLSEDEIDEMIGNFAKEDDTRTKTFTRIIVEKFLSNYSWYFPMKDKRNGPSLSKAYAYYEHVTLPRHFIAESKHVLRRAEPGEKDEETELYNPFTTPQSALIEWGIGVDLYFSTLRIMSIILLIAALINLPNMLFYGSDEYSPDGKSGTQLRQSSITGVRISLDASAVCATYEWVVCTDCTFNQYNADYDRWRYANTTDGTSLVQKNACDYDNILAQGMVNWVTLLFLGITMSLVSMYLRAREVRFDEDKLTATDYSVIVKNPPKDLYDPDVYRDYFNQFADKQVTFVAVALNNQELLRKLIARRIHRNNLRIVLPKGTDLEDEDLVRSAVARLVKERDSEPRGCIMGFFDTCIFPFLRIFNKFLKPETLVDKVFQLTAEIKELQEKKHPVSKVFVTFETEEGQRAALSALTVGKLDIMFNNKGAVAPSAIFHDHILRVEEPPEPSAVRWLDISTPFWKKMTLRTLNLGMTLAVVALCGYLVAQTRNNLGPAYSGPLTAAFNSIIPHIVKLLMIFERHSSEGSFQTSLYLKITLFRWINTAILTKIITPFTSTITPFKESVLPAIKSIVLAEIWLVPALRLLDIMGNLKKHLLAPRARNQELMNLNFQGTFYNMGERYTDLTKVLFLVFFYSAIFPAIFFFGGAILIIQYYTDKYCLMRIWGWSPSLGSELAQFSRRYFFSGSVVAFAVVSAYAWAQFPYDDLCPSPEDGSGQLYNGTYDVVFAQNGTTGSVTVANNEPFILCRQNWFDRHDNTWSFPPIPSRLQTPGKVWMTSSQDELSYIYGWTVVAVLVGFVIIFFGNATRNFLLSLFRGVREFNGQPQAIDFSCNTEISAYVPQIKLKGFPFPFLACNVDHIDQNLIGWNDPQRSYDYYNLIFDVPWDGMPREKTINENTRNTARIAHQEEYDAATEGITESMRDKIPRNPIFSIVRHYPPYWQRALMNKKEKK